MTPQFTRALERTIKIEGGYVNNPHDRGGPTNLGVTLATLSRWTLQQLGRPATLDDLRRLNVEGARQLYHDLYWSETRLPCQEIAEWWEPMGFECFDNAVLHGPATSATLLQKALNILNLNARAWPDLKVDGWAGKVTLEAIRKAGELPRGRERLMVAVNAYQAKFFIELAEHDPTQEEFIGGWLLKRVQFGGAT